MVKNIRLVIAVFCLHMTGVLLHPVAAGEKNAYPVNPTEQPLLVVRADKAARFQEVLDTRPLRALGLSGRDYSGRLPGVDAKVESLKAMLTGLAEDNAENIWYCLAQSGSIARQTGAIGWSTTAALPDTSREESERWFASKLGLDVARRAIKALPLPDAAAGLIVSRDSAAYTELLGGGGRPDERWRTTLASFLAEDSKGVGLLVSGRPLLGMLSMALGIDFRSELSRTNLSFPESIQVEIFNTKGDLGFALQCNSLIPETALSPAPETQTILENETEALLTLHFPAPGQLSELFRLDDIPVFLANLNARQLIPETATLSIWLDVQGQPAWSFVGLMPDAQNFSNQLRRIYEWLDVFANTPSPLVRKGTATSASGQELVSVTYGRHSFYSGTAAAPNGAVYWALSSSAANWPDPGSFKQRQESQSRLVSFTAQIPPQYRQSVLSAAGKNARRMNLTLPNSDTLDTMLAGEDDGFITIEKGNLRFQSQHGLLPLLLPALIELFDL